MESETTLFTIKETAEKLKISEPYLYKLMKKEKEKGGIKPVKIGRRTLFSLDEIQDLLLSAV